MISGEARRVVVAGRSGKRYDFKAGLIGREKESGLRDDRRGLSCAIINAKATAEGLVSTKAYQNESGQAGRMNSPSLIANLRCTGTFDRLTDSLYALDSACSVFLGVLNRSWQS